MGEMDIYTRRRLVAIGGLIGFILLLVLLVRSCGGDEEPQTAVPTAGTTGATGPVTLSRNEYIAQADAICAQANSSVGSLDPEDPRATAKEFKITSRELDQLNELEPERVDSTLRKFLANLRAVVKALDSKATALDRGDTLAADEAQIAIDENEAEARALGERYGFADCGQFLDAGQGPADGGAGGAAATGTDTGAVAPTEPVAPAPTEPVTPAPTTTTPVTPPADDSGGITP